MKELKISDIKSALNDYDKLKSRLTRSIMSACNRIISTNDIKYYLNKSGVKVIGNIGRFYVTDECEIKVRKKIIKRLVLHGDIKWFPGDEYEESFNEGNAKILRYEYKDGNKLAVIEVKSSQRIINHKIGDVVPGTNQLFIKLPILREKVNDNYRLINGNDLIVKNITSKISLDEFDSWINCDIDTNKEDSPYYTIKLDNEFTEEYINLCEYLNNRLKLNIDIDDYARRYNKDLQESNTDEE